MTYSMPITCFNAWILIPHPPIRVSIFLHNCSEKYISPFLSFSVSHHHKLNYSTLPMMRLWVIYHSYVILFYISDIKQVIRYALILMTLKYTSCHNTLLIILGIIGNSQREKKSFQNYLENNRRNNKWLREAGMLMSLEKLLTSSKFCKICYGWKWYRLHCWVTGMANIR